MRCLINNSCILIFTCTCTEEQVISWRLLINGILIIFPIWPANNYILNAFVFSIYSYYCLHLSRSITMQLYSKLSWRKWMFFWYGLWLLIICVCYIMAVIHQLCIVINKHGVFNNMLNKDVVSFFFLVIQLDIKGDFNPKFKNYHKLENHKNYHNLVRPLSHHLWLCSRYCSPLCASFVSST